ncbi:hypothetical protein [Chthonomonas calidirosea]|uniref:hypothetical protein n=1 Tax=Chthonomonas calidirosea TaxID=454171 RepID=UPI00039AF86E|nr:hypothetical protein [Chthonomonas calidirosea]
MPNPDSRQRNVRSRCFVSKLKEIRLYFEESKLTPKQLAQQQQYREILQRLEKHAAHQLPACTAERTAFTVIPESKVEA